MPPPSKKDKHSAVPAGMAPRMQTQVQKWAKMTAELGHGHGTDSTKASSSSSGAAAAAAAAAGAGGGAGAAGAAIASDGRMSSKKSRSIAPGAAASSALRAAHRRDRYPSVAVGAGYPLDPSSLLLSGPSPPICMLCLVRFASRQQLRDHEALSPRHRSQMRDRAARRTALQRYAKVEEKTSKAAAAAADSDIRAANTATSAATSTAAAAATGSSHPPVPHLPTHIKRLPRRRGDLAPVYTSYAVPLSSAASGTATTATINATATTNATTATAAALDHCCLLCRRRFHSRASLRLHERESALHRARTRDPAAVTAAVQAVQEAAVAAAEKKQQGADGNDAHEEHEDEEDEVPPPPHRPLLRMRPAAAEGAFSSTTMRYRDRARERRLAFGQKGVPASRKRTAARTTAGAASSSASISAATTTVVTSSASYTTPAATDPSSSSAASKGAAMLGKMGWTAGLGLGAQGTGLTEAIAAAAYVPGVGLGAQGGKLGDAADVAARRTESRYADFVEQTQETARQRYLALDRAEAEAARTAAAAVAATTTPGLETNETGQESGNMDGTKDRE